jgi:hypothetical protein
VAGYHRVGDGSAEERNTEHAPFGALEALSNGLRHFARSAHSDSHLAAAISNDHHRAKGEASAALDHFGHPADIDHFFPKVFFLHPLSASD